MSVRALANWMLVLSVLQIAQAVAIGWTAVELAALRQEWMLYIASKS
jgi:hypothetical protein